MNDIKSRPFIKWAGGKGSLLKQLDPLFPSELKNGNIENYYEPFLGGGAMFYYIKQTYNIKNIYLYDINPDIVILNKVVQGHISELLPVLTEIEDNYISLKYNDRKSYFYEIRSKFNEQLKTIDFTEFNDEWITRSSYFIFLNKTCFNGLYRVNRLGEFNVPFGNYAKPTIVDFPNLISCNKLLQHVNIECNDFLNSVPSLKSNSFVYIDPPYRPLAQTSNFNDYYTNKFDDVCQIKLAEILKEKSIDSTIKLMTSNSNPKIYDINDDFFDRIYGSQFNMSYVYAARSINSNSQERAKISELVIRNYY